MRGNILQPDAWPHCSISGDSKDLKGVQKMEIDPKVAALSIQAGQCQAREVVDSAVVSDAQEVKKFGGPTGGADSGAASLLAKFKRGWPITGALRMCSVHEQTSSINTCSVVYMLPVECCYSLPRDVCIAD
jgi:hypothetical protein